MRLICSYENLKKLSGDFKDLEYLYCEENRITELPEGMISLKHLSCWTNCMIKLPNDMKNLEFLNCSYNKIKEIPKYMLSLIYLSCINNNLTEFLLFEREGCLSYQTSRSSRL